MGNEVAHPTSHAEMRQDGQCRVGYSVAHADTKKMGNEVAHPTDFRQRERRATKVEKTQVGKRLVPFVPLHPPRFALREKMVYSKEILHVLPN